MTQDSSDSGIAARVEAKMSTPSKSSDDAKPAAKPKSSDEGQAGCTFEDKRWSQGVAEGRARFKADTSGCCQGDVVYSYEKDQENDRRIS